MIKFIAAVVLVAALTSTSHAQQQATPIEMSGALAAAMAQVDAVRKLHIQSEAKAAVLADENAKLKARIQEIERPPEKK